MKVMPNKHFRTIQTIQKEKHYMKNIRISRINDECKKIKRIGKVALKGSKSDHPVIDSVRIMMDETRNLEKTLQQYRKKEPTDKFILLLEEIHKEVVETREKLEQSFEELRGA